MTYTLNAQNATFTFTPTKSGAMVSVSVLRAGADSATTKRLGVKKARAMYIKLLKKGLHKA